MRQALLDHAHANYTDISSDVSAIKLPSPRQHTLDEGISA